MAPDIFHSAPQTGPSFVLSFKPEQYSLLKAFCGALDDFLGNSLDTPVFHDIDRRPCPLQPLASLSTFPDVACALFGPVRHAPRFTITRGRPGNVPEGDLHQ